MANSSGEALRARLYTLYWIAQAASLIGLIAAASIVVTSLVGARITSTPGRVFFGLVAALLLPLGLRAALRRRGAKRGKVPGLGRWFFAGWNLALIAVLVLGFASQTGEALRRRGDWFFGEADGWVPRRYRLVVNDFGRWLEGGFSTPAAPAPLPARRMQPPSRSPALATLPPVVDGWFHPLAGPRRLLPANSFRRFGARRLGRRPRECEQGHCGVDLIQAIGSPVYAAGAGVITAAEHDPTVRRVNGRFVRIRHEGGDVITAYVHLDSVRSDLKAGMRVRGGERIGTLGQTGVNLKTPHLHFAIRLRLRRRYRYIDPEPLLWFWPLPKAAGRGPRHSTPVASIERRPGHAWRARGAACTAGASAVGCMTPHASVPRSPISR